MKVFVQDVLLSAAGSVSLDLPVAVELEVAEVVVEAVEATVVNAAPVVIMRVVPLAELGPARTARETGWPLCSAAETCDSSAFCWASVPPATFHVPAAKAEAKPGAIPLPEAVATRVVPPAEPGCPVVTTY